jgi:DNA-binding transcriptional ArsR family regulator
LAKESIGEETYSVIFTSLKHPIRRRILRMLSEKPFAFSEILETIKIDSGHLTYHLENLGDLVVHSQDGNYKLSSIGLAAVKLMGGVEEQPADSSTKINFRHTTSKIIPIFLAVSLIMASLYVATFTVTTSTAMLNRDNQAPTVFTLAAGQTFEFDVTLAQWAISFPLGSSYGGLYLVSNSPDYGFLVPRTPDSASASFETMWLDLRLNSSGFLLPSTDMWPIDIVKNSSLTIYKPDGKAVTTDVHEAYGAVYGEHNLWTWGGLDHYVSSSVQVAQLGAYHFVLTNTSPSNWNGTVLPQVQWQLMNKPYYYWGVAGIVVASACLILITVQLLATKRKK